MVTGSPGSLFLRPEHKVHLGDMGSLDFGVTRGSSGLVAGDDGGWLFGIKDVCGTLFSGLFSINYCSIINYLHKLYH
jgi:hypothetical protein